LKLTAKKPPEEDPASPSGEGSKPFTLPTPHWKLTVHAELPGFSPHAGRWLEQKRVSGSWWNRTPAYRSDSEGEQVES
jgi:hypothetical protein